MDELTKEELASLAKRPVRELELPALGRKVYWRALNAAERIALESTLEFGEDNKPTSESMQDWSARIVAAHLCSSSGQRLYDYMKRDEDGDFCNLAELDSLNDADWDSIEPIHIAVSKTKDSLKN